jgi:hypothetical protein
MGCQFINAHSHPISAVFNFNTNISIGDVSHVYYSTLYTSKSTQEEDAKKQLQIGRGVIKRIKQLLEEKHLHPGTPGVIGSGTSKDGTNHQRYKPCFGEGLSRLLSGLNAATTRNVISATMAHLTPCNGGSRFVFSHEFSDLLVGQMEASLEGQETNVCIRSNKSKDGILKTWPDSLADDYIHRPIDKNFEQMCSYAMSKRHKKYFRATKTSFDVTPNKESVIKEKGAKKYKFRESHRGYNFSYLTKLKHPTIPRITLPPRKLCSLEELELQQDKPTEESCNKRKMYAKMALLMFYPFCQLNKLTCAGSYWKKFYKELQHHLNKETTKFWKKGFNILQNIEDRSTLQKHLKKAMDLIAMSTVKTKQKELTLDVPNYVVDILQMGLHSK